MARVSAAAVAAALALSVSLAFVSEGTVKTTYRDPVGVLTVCTGHTGPEVRPNQTYSDAQCSAILNKDVQHAQDVVLKYTTGPMTPSQLAALTDFTFNVGEGNFKTSTLRRLWNEGKYTQACQELPKWKYSKGRVMPGLIKRRAKEMALCLSSTAS